MMILLAPILENVSGLAIMAPVSLPVILQHFQESYLPIRERKALPDATKEMVHGCLLKPKRRVENKAEPVYIYLTTRPLPLSLQI